MGQQGGNVVGDLVSPLPQQRPKDDPALPLPTTGDGSTQTSEGQQPPNYKELGAAAAKHDFQTGLGSGWEYDPEAMKQQIGRLRDLRDGKVRAMQQYTDQLINITAPGAEQVSRGFTDVANPSGASHNAQFERYRHYLDAYIQTLEDIDRAYQEQDQAALEALRSEEI